MVRMLSLCALLAAWPAVGLAQEKPVASGAPVRLTLYPMPAPVPALKYQLLPELKEINPGNAIQGFLKCFMASQGFFFAKESEDNRERWGTAHLEVLRAESEKLQDYGGTTLRQADYAARLDTVDWQILPRCRAEGYNLLLPDVQYLRMLAAALKVRSRSEIADARFDDAVRTAKTTLALARAYNEHPGFMASLVGAAVATIQFDALEEMIQQPGSPNLYWALTNLPSPFIDTRKSLQGEAIFASVEFQALDSGLPLAADYLEKIKVRLSQRLGGINGAKDQAELRDWIDARAEDEEYVRAARLRLTRAGVASDHARDFSPLQVVLQDEKLQFEIRLDEGRKLMTLPFWQAEAGLQAAGPARKGEHQIAEVFLPPFLKLRLATLRSERAIALLRQIEAIRLYAAENKGKLPARLEDLSVPVPIDPIHGKPFDYKLEGEGATLKATSPVGFGGTVNYMLVIRK